MTTGVLAIVVLCFTFSFPESSRWLALKGRYQEAREVIALIDDVEPDSEHVTFILTSITSMNELSAESASWTSLFSYGKEKMLYRLILASMTQLFSQMSGSALITYYAEQLFSTVGLSHDLSKILGATDLTFKLICCSIPFFTIERAGRRKLLMIAASGMSTCMVSCHLPVCSIRTAFVFIQAHHIVLPRHLRFSGDGRQPRPRLRRHCFRLCLCHLLSNRLPGCQLSVLARGHYDSLPCTRFGYLDRYALALGLCCCPYVPSPRSSGECQD